MRLTKTQRNAIERAWKNQREDLSLFKVYAALRASNRYARGGTRNLALSPARTKHTQSLLMQETERVLRAYYRLDRESEALFNINMEECLNRGLSYADTRALSGYGGFSGYWMPEDLMQRKHVAYRKRLAAGCAFYYARELWRLAGKRMSTFDNLRAQVK